MNQDLKSKLQKYSSLLYLLGRAKTKEEFLEIVRKRAESFSQFNCDIAGSTKEYIIGPLKIQTLESNKGVYYVYLNSSKIGEVSVC